MSLDKKPDHKPLFYRWIALTALCLLIVMPVSAWQDSLNNGEITYYTYGSGTTLSYAPISVAYSDTVYMFMAPYSSSRFAVTPWNGAASSYFAYTSRRQVSGSYYGAYGFFSNGGSLLSSSPTNTLLLVSAPTRLELVHSGTNVYVYINGALTYTITGQTSASIYGYGILSPTDTGIDDFSFGNAFTDTGVVSAMPHTFHIVKDFLSPTSVVQKDGSGNTVSSTEMHIQWSLGPQADGWTMATAPNTRYRITIQAPSGTQCYNQYVNITAAGAATGIITIPFNATYLGTAPIEYGIYNVVLYDGSGIKSTDYFSVIGTGANLYWDQATYGNGQVATLTYSITAGYYDPTNYAYSIKIVDIYGTTKTTLPLSSQTGTVTTTLSDYDAGVYYAELMATPVAGGSASMLYHSATEVTAYVYLSGGYVLNAENATALSGATVTATQGSTSVTYTSNAAGAWGNTSQYWLTGSAITLISNKSGYNNNTLSLNPVGSGTIALNISMSPTSPVHTGVAIGGIVRQGDYTGATTPIPYPISGATVYLRVNGSSATPSSTTSNLAGWYIFNSLVSGTTYDIWSEKTGFGNSAVHQATASGM